MSKPTCSISDCPGTATRRGWCTLHYQRWRRHGDPLTFRPDATRSCKVEACEFGHYGLGYCKVHWTRLKKTGDPLALRPHFSPLAGRAEDLNPQRRGDDVGYSGVHQRMRETLVRDHACAHCGSGAEEGSGRMTTETPTRRSPATASCTRPTLGTTYRSAVGVTGGSIKGKRYGSTEPRICTPPLRDLTPETSLGYSVIEFAETVLEIELLPWQRALLIRMLELLPDNSLRFRTVIVLVARQNGKSTLSQIVALWFMYVYGTALVIGTAQDLDVAEEIWQGAVDLVEETPELDDLKENVIKVNGKKALVLKSGERYKVKAANRRAGRGLSGDVILLDELREHQSWDAWGAITKTTMARAMALILALSNAGDATSIVLRYLRKMTHADVGDPDGINSEDAAPLADDEPDDFDIEDDDSVAIFEWSAPPGCDIRDRGGWAQANPALGYTITERTIASAARTDPEWIFRTEVLCQWSDGTLEGPFPPGTWEASADPDSKRADGAEIALCVETSWDRSTSFVGLASIRADGMHHVELIAQRAGTDWLVPWLTAEERSEAVKGAPAAVQAKGAPASSLIADLRDAGVNVVEWGGADLPNGTGNFYDAVRGGADVRGVRHRSDPVLNLSAATTVPKLTEGGAFMWDRKKSQAASPLIAVTGALWCLTSGMPAEPQRSAYETSRLEVL